MFKRSIIKHIYCLFIFTAAAVQPKPAEPVAGEMNISVSIDRPEIIMIEDQSKQDTSALMLDVSY
jgi:hypothetical protein